MKFLVFTQKNFIKITLYSGISAKSLQLYFKRKTSRSRLRRLFKEHPLEEACEILGRAHSIAYRKEYPQGSTVQAEDVLLKVKSLKLNYSVTNR